MNTRTRNVSILLLATVGLLAVGRVHAATCASGSVNLSATDQALWNVHGCQPNYINWQYQRYDLRAEDWWEKGWNDACNPQVVYPKHWNATYLIDYAISFDAPWWNPSGRAFHHSVDYGGMTEHSSSGYHDGQRHLMAGYSAPSRNLLGLYQTEFGTPNHLNTFCEAYDIAANANATPDMRAAVMVHEGTHGWFHKIGTNGGNCGGHHCPGEIWPISASPFCTLGTCDFFYFHGATVYPKGTLWYQDNNQGVGKYFHSPFQNQIEFLCDIANFGDDWVPLSVVKDAQGWAQQVATQAIINGPGYRCGIMKPW